MKTQPLPLQEIISRVVVPKRDFKERSQFWSGLGTMPRLDRHWAKQPTLDFINYSLRGVGQVVFINNPLSGLLILLALFISSPWIGLMSLVAVVSSTVTAIALKLDRDTIRSGIYGYNGVLVGAALATFGLSGNGGWNWWWGIAVIIFSALTTVIMKTFGNWWFSTFKCPPLTLPFNIATLLFLGLVMLFPQSLFQLGETAIAETPTVPIEVTRLLASLPIGFGQVFLAHKLIAGSLILLAVAICTPFGAVVGLVGAALGVVAGLIFTIAPEDLYAGLWGYNSILSAMAIGGIFYAPNLRSLFLSAGCAFGTALAVPVLGTILTKPFGLPVLTLPFCLVTIAFFVFLQRFMPSLLPVAPNTITTPEEHRQRYLMAKKIVSKFRRHLKTAIGTQSLNHFDEASDSVKGDLRYVFNRIDTNRDGKLSVRELANYLVKEQQVMSNNELIYLFQDLDRDNSGTIDFNEFGELILKHQSLMQEYDIFTTYLMPVANKNDLIKKINVTVTSVSEPHLTREEIYFLQQQTIHQSFTHNQFIKLLLLT